MMRKNKSNPTGWWGGILSRRRAHLSRRSSARSEDGSPKTEKRCNKLMRGHFRLRTSCYAVTGCHPSLRRGSNKLFLPSQGLRPGLYMLPRHAARLLNSARLRSQTVRQILICRFFLKAPVIVSTRIKFGLRNSSYFLNRSCREMALIVRPLVKSSGYMCKASSIHILGLYFPQK